ncbi:MAG: hypothetical protein ACRER0_05380 [Gammaproteobacteria bacterium]
MKRPATDYDSSAPLSPQGQQQKLVATALKLPGVAEAFAIYGQAILSLPFTSPINGAYYATDINSVTIE